METPTPASAQLVTRSLQYVTASLSLQAFANVGGVHWAAAQNVQLGPHPEELALHDCSRQSAMLEATSGLNSSVAVLQAGPQSELSQEGGGPTSPRQCPPSIPPSTGEDPSVPAGSSPPSVGELPACSPVVSVVLQARTSHSGARRLLHGLAARLA